MASANLLRNVLLSRCKPILSPGFRRTIATANILQKKNGKKKVEMLITN